MFDCLVAGERSEWRFGFTNLGYVVSSKGDDNMVDGGNSWVRISIKGCFSA